MDPIILENFEIHLHDRVTFKKNTFSIPAGTSTVIMGPTGTGKSVFLKSIAGILPTNVFTFQGNLKVNGIIITTIKTRRLCAEATLSTRAL